MARIECRQGAVLNRRRPRNDAGITLTELVMAVIILAMLFAVFASIMYSAMGLLREADTAGEAMRLAEAQMETLRALPPARRPQGRDLPPLTGAEALDRLPRGTCTLTVEPYPDADAPAGLLLVRVRVGWTGECGRRDLELATVVGPSRR
jgi:type II secretory pathway pseudopilin PulG